MFSCVSARKGCSGMQSSPLQLHDSALRAAEQQSIRVTTPQLIPVETAQSGNNNGSAQNIGSSERLRPNPNSQNESYDEVPQPNMKRSSRHVIYAVEIFIFAIVGWGWLALREFIGSSPVMDVSVLLCLLICSICNLLMALIYYTTDQFQPAAQAFFSNTLAIWVLYAYSLTESTTGGWGPLCCDGKSIYSVANTYAAAYFGGLPYHQTVGAVSLAFISVFLVLAAGQVRVCIEDPRVWILNKVTTSLTCLVSLHLGLFAYHSGACGSVEMGRAVIGLAVLALVMMTNIVSVFVSFVYFRLYSYSLADEVNGLIQMLSDLLLIILLMAVSCVLSSGLGGRPSSAIIIIFVGIVLWQMGSAGARILLIRIQNRASPSRTPNRSQMPRNEDYSPSAPRMDLVGSLYSIPGHHTRPVMLLPDIREVRLQESRRREKAW